MTETSKAKRQRSATGGPGKKPAQPELKVTVGPEKSEQRALAEIALEPAAHAMATARLFNAGSFGSKIELEETYLVVRDELKAVANGDLSQPRALLAAQAIALNSIFTEMSRRAAANMGEYLSTTETYMRLALKAQAQSRATIEALDKLTNGREQTVKHVHVDNRGGQAVIAENVTAGGQRNGKADDQCHGTRTGAVGSSSALLGADPIGNGVPIPSRERETAVPDARRDESRRTQGQS